MLESNDQIIISLCHQGKKLAAVKYRKYISGELLKEAKEYVDKLALANPIGKIPERDEERERLERFTIAAMQGLCTHNMTTSPIVARMAVKIAKETIEELDKESA